MFEKGVHKTPVWSDTWSHLTNASSVFRGYQGRSFSRGKAALLTDSGADLYDQSLVDFKAHEADRSSALVDLGFSLNVAFPELVIFGIAGEVLTVDLRLAKISQGAIKHRGVGAGIGLAAVDVGL
jgi:hypothetical protein